ncbi:MAG: hypothetical protein Q9225_000837 [Loekoesia sp. 1 TL-2023]
MALRDGEYSHQLRLAADLIPNLVDKRATLTPDHTFAEYPNSPDDYDQGFKKISYTHLANAVNGIAWWLYRTLGPSQVFETLAYIGPNDMRYPALILGAVKVGYTIFLTSPRNSIAAHLSLFDRLSCNILPSPSSQPPAVSAIKAQGRVRVVEVPEVDYLLDTPHPQYPFHKTLTSALQEPLFVV